MHGLEVPADNAIANHMTLNIVSRPSPKQWLMFHNSNDLLIVSWFETIDFHFSFQWNMFNILFTDELLFNVSVIVSGMSNMAMATSRASWRLKSPSARLLFKYFVLAYNKRIIKTSPYLSFLGGIHRWREYSSLQKASNVTGASMSLRPHDSPNEYD